MEIEALCFINEGKSYLDFPKVSVASAVIHNILNSIGI